MPKARETKILEIEELPYLLTINEIVDLLGYSRPEVDSWFKDKTFPVINSGISKVNKYDLFQWLDENKKNPQCKIKRKNVDYKILDILSSLNDNINNLLERKVE